MTKYFKSKFFNKVLMHIYVLNFFKKTLDICYPLLFKTVQFSEKNFMYFFNIALFL